MVGCGRSRLEAKLYCSDSVPDHPHRRQPPITLLAYVPRSAPYCSYSCGAPGRSRPNGSKCGSNVGAIGPHAGRRGVRVRRCRRNALNRRRASWVVVDDGRSPTTRQRARPAPRENYVCGGRWDTHAARMTSWWNAGLSLHFGRLLDATSYSPRAVVVIVSPLQSSAPRRSRSATVSRALRPCPPSIEILVWRWWSPRSNGTSFPPPRCGDRASGDVSVSSEGAGLVRALLAGRTRP